ncbi:MAG: mobile mystery protein A [Desulfovibrionales bacterium]|nr:mobile mystery protein A [Desulfovibrionales bacterium]
MSYWEEKLIRQQLDQKLISAKGLSIIEKLPFAWIKTIRTALGMTSTQLAKRAGLSQSRIIHMEKAEIDGNLKLSTMKKVAEALDMRFVYGFIPNQSLEQMVNDQALKVALKRMDKLNHTMRLEEQELSGEEKAEALNDLIQKILIEQPKDFWDQ